MNFSTFLSSIVLLSCICPIRADDAANKGIATQEDPDSKSMVQVKDVEQSSLKRPLINEHEWVEITNIHRVLGAEVKAAQATSEHNHRISRIRDSVKPLYTVMPKDDDGSLSKETARYALHRYFTEKHGWSIKGLQPAGAAWQHVMTVESDMTDINKYMLPAYMEDAVVSLMNKTKIDLDVLAVMISTYEHLDHQTMLATMQSILATFDMTSGGVKSEDEVREILETYLIVYAFGVDIDTKNKYEIRDTKANLQLNHPAWGSLASFMWDIKMQMFPKSALDFGELAHVALAFGDKYAKWQEEDCSRAQNYFVGMPSFRHGSVRLLDVSPSSSLGRRTLFEETFDFVSDLGVVTHKTHSKHARLVVPNYLSSQSMCLATASFHSVCCENKCESLYTRLEQGVGAPAATAEQIADSADSLPGQKHDWSMQDLKDMADEEGKMEEGEEEPNEDSKEDEEKEVKHCPPNYKILNVDSIEPRCTGNFERIAVDSELKPNEEEHKMRPFFKNEHGMYLHFWVGLFNEIHNWVCGEAVTHEQGQRGFVSSVNGDIDCPDGYPDGTPEEMFWEASHEGGWTRLGDSGEPILVMQTAAADEYLEALQNPTPDPIVASLNNTASDQINSLDGFLR